MLFFFSEWVYLTLSLCRRCSHYIGKNGDKIANEMFNNVKLEYRNSLMPKLNINKFRSLKKIDPEKNVLMLK